MRKILFIGLALLPLLYWPWSVWSILLWIELCIVFGLVQYFRDKTFLRVLSPLWKYLLVFFSVILLSSILGVDPMKSLFGNSYRIDGIWTMFHLMAIALFLSFVWKKFWEPYFVGSLAMGAAVCSLWAVIDGIRALIFHDPRVVLWQGALGVSFGNPVFLAGYLVATLPCWIYLFYHLKPAAPRVVVIIGLSIQMTAIVLTRSWAGYIGILLFLVGWIWQFASVKVRRIMLPLTIISIVVLFLGYGLIQWGHRLPISTLSEGRIRIFMKALIGWTKRPIFGWGWANFDYVFKSVDWPVKFYHDAYVDKAHSMLLEILTTSGILGVIAYIVLVWKTLKRLLVNRSVFGKTAVCIYVLYLFHSQTNVISVNEELLFWLVTGVAWSA